MVCYLREDPLLLLFFLLRNKIKGARAGFYSLETVVKFTNGVRGNYGPMGRSKNLLAKAKIYCKVQFNYCALKYTTDALGPDLFTLANINNQGEHVL